jgi:hypothetical protein
MERGTFKEAWRKYGVLYLFIIFTLISLLYRGKVHANYEHYQAVRHTEGNRFELSVLNGFENQLEIDRLRTFYTMNAEYDECKTHIQKRDFYKKNAERCFNDAKNMCWYFPSKTRDKCLYAFSIATSMGSPGELRSKLIVCLISTLIEYGADCFNEWEEMNTKLYWAQYHYEMYELYCEIVKQGNQ